MTTDDPALVDRKQLRVGFNGPLWSLYWILALFATLAVSKHEMAAVAVFVSAMAIIEAMEKLSARDR